MTTPALPGTPRKPGDLWAELPPRIVFFDGDCAFCNRSVRWILAHDRSGRFHFAPLAGATASRLGLLGAELLAPDAQSVVLAEHLDRGEVRFYRRSAALRRILRELEGPLPGLLSLLLGMLPEAAADLLYDAVARRRGQLGACRIPRDGAREGRFLP